MRLGEARGKESSTHGVQRRRATVLAQGPLARLFRRVLAPAEQGPVSLHGTACFRSSPRSLTAGPRALSPDPPPPATTSGEAAQAQAARPSIALPVRPIKPTSVPGLLSNPSRSGRGSPAWPSTRVRRRVCGARGMFSA
eukprot:13811-Rhodomonas_salina.7